MTYTNIDVLNNAKLSPLRLALAQLAGDRSCFNQVAALIRAGANLELKDQCGDTTILTAIRTHDAEVLAALARRASSRCQT